MKKASVWCGPVALAPPLPYSARGTAGTDETTAIVGLCVSGFPWMDPDPSRAAMAGSFPQEIHSVTKGSERPNGETQTSPSTLESNQKYLQRI